MDSELFSRRHAERFAQLLDEANGGRRHHVRSRADDQLGALVALGQQLGTAAPAAEPRPGFRADLRATLMATAEREGVGVPTGDAALRDPVGATGRRVAGGLIPRNLLAASATARRARARCAILAGITAGAVAVSGISAASENAIPGDALYGMKRSAERAQLALASSDLSRGQLFLDFARTRLVEATAVRGDRFAFAAVLDDMDEDTRHGVRLLTTATAHRSDPAGLDAVDAFLDGQRRAVAALADGASRAERDRTRQSLLLLDAAGRRSATLRTNLPCGIPATGRTDSLGPVPGSCR
ncbi:DUF5667 domain-containing protein [Micromonospora sp. WMMD882]|uniref:DUF5667 domain-containing protein n=1 Tax=Micromonospora sp. WMMD882 TaxID=3015151 RepID=UPI00248BD9FF|nr:DUF5667 domain-containing protein [Micromonospora sp. WMMD882]WBB79046.1 DUF5667 domain-containing protein [Micromonospora sp. WMMD882]